MPDEHRPADLLARMPLAPVVRDRARRGVGRARHGLAVLVRDRSHGRRVLHGGALMTLADSLGALCASLNLPEGATTSTIESKTNFFRAARAGRAHAVTRPLHVGRTTIVVQTDVTGGEGRRVAQVTQTQALLAPPS
ncbi:MAG TPA: PaaI family thioesterase [Acidimicrobiales bacterium]|nr:PaaI family thioesterase [Acidimicrobiales bacterium]